MIKYQLIETPAFFIIQTSEGVRVANIRTDGIKTDKELKERGETLVKALNKAVAMEEGH